MDCRKEHTTVDALLASLLGREVPVTPPAVEHGFVRRVLYVKGRRGWLLWICLYTLLRSPHLLRAWFVKGSRGRG